ncbi:hypothetical protein K437DRAFT_262579 [Tilletiaria anomala UBC 951]|uniref:Conserved oligomeric Golgi complex subunit 1 n=1 Tax=Tilletiaria anomala (strain ATCC 24038 / CBS 436.72 / UBC 951) TaxID=1037660 RepID=A0A066W2L6_TILAU|nr:uncharacterized protein K437DRAFT_262579 [Tilletiaria anomala UBC 951]KDN46788.1 hypothetical protein K437DRAFT_262579 [Tilletiaria anomala UBC 951]
MSSLDRPARRHIRAKAVLTSSTSQDGIANCAPAISSAEAAAIASSSAMASRPPASSTAFMGLDPLSAEPDAVFEKLHVKAAEEFEQSVRDAYQESQAALRSLVSTQYPEMLGTASSVIEMAGSSRRLLQHITTFRDTALAPEPLGPSKLEKGKAREDDIAAETEIYRLAAATKVVDELPAFGRDFLSRRRAHPFTLHAAWAYMVGRTAWGYLSERTKMLAGSEAAVLFPSLVNKREELAALRTEVIQTCTKQLEQDLISYTAMMSHSIAMVLLDHARPSEMLQFVLGLRKRALAAMSYAGDTIDAVEARHGTEVPPHARLSARTIIDKISTKASLMNFLPDEIVKYCPFVDFSGAGTSQEEFDRALSQICTWSEDVISTCWQEQGLQSMFAGLATVADISSVAAAIFSYTSEVKQILRTSLHAGGDRTDAIHHTVDQSVDAFRSAAQRVLDERLVGLYRERLDDIARSFTYECDALTLEEPPDLIQWLLADGQGASLDDRLCGHTPAVRRVLAHAEQQASDVAQQMQRFWEDAPRSKEHSGHLEHLRKQFANSVTALFDSLASALQKIPRSANNILFAHHAVASIGAGSAA